MRNSPSLEHMSEEISALRESLDYHQRRPLIKLNKEVMLTLYVVADIVFKFVVIYTSLK
jgi:hypothetical protein